MNATSESSKCEGGRDVEVSVVLVVKDEPSIIQSLDLLKPQCIEHNAECIVVDASEGRLSSIEQRFGWVRWIAYSQPSDRRFTISHQRNIGVKAAKAKIVAFCDAGGEPGADWLGQLLQALEQFQTQCVCGPTLSNDAEPTPPVNLLDDGADVFLPATGNMMFFKEAFETIGGFDERFDHGEDIDFGWRLKEGGVRVVCARDAVMTMSFGDGRRRRRRAWFYGRATPFLLRRHAKNGSRYVRRYPDVLFYPIWLAGLPFAVVASVKLWWVLLVWLLLIGALVVRNRRERKLGEFMALKLVRAAGFLSSLPRALFAPEWSRKF